MAAQYPQDSWYQQTTGWYQQVPAAYPAPPSKPPETRELGDARKKVLEAISRRKGSDRTLSTAWVLAPLLVTIVLTTVGFIMIFGIVYDAISAAEEGTDYEVAIGDLLPGYMLTIIASAFHIIVFAALIYLLLDRKNKHIYTEQGLREAIMTYVSAAASAHGSRNAVIPEMYTMEAAHTSALRSDKISSPAMLTVAFGLFAGLAIPISIAEVMVIESIGSDFGSEYFALLGVAFLLRLIEFIIVLHILNVLGSHDYDHATQWNNFVYGALYGLYKVGTPVMIPYAPRAPEERSFLLYLLITIFSGGLFLYYWWYASIKDPNEHYKQHWEIEDAIAAAIAR